MPPLQALRIVNLQTVLGRGPEKVPTCAVLAKNYRPTHGSDGPSWLTFLAHAKDSLWSLSDAYLELGVDPDRRE
jgi:hypothetical protein